MTAFRLAQLVLLSTWLATATAWAEVPGSLEVGAFGGWHQKSDNNELGNGFQAGVVPDSGVGFGLRGGYAIVRQLSVEGELKLVASSIRKTSDSASILGLRALGVAQLPVDGAVRPYVRVGVGTEMLMSDSKAIDKPSDSDTVAIAGVGSRFALGDQLSLRLDLNALVVPGLDQKTEVEFEGWLGLSWQFGLAAAANAGADRDHDGVADAADRCPTEPETVNGFEDQDGCPDQAPVASAAKPEGQTKVEPVGTGKSEEPAKVAPGKAAAVSAPAGASTTVVDADGDGVGDGDDKCPGERETKNHFKDGDGCADSLPGALKKFAGPVAAVQFKGPKLLPKSAKVLDALVKALGGLAEVKVEVVGTADEGSTAEANRKLGQRRADAVKAALVAKGLAADRITAIGVAADKPAEAAAEGKADAKGKAKKAKKAKKGKSGLAPIAFRYL